MVADGRSSEKCTYIKSNEAGDMEEILVWIYTQNGVLADM